MSDYTRIIEFIKYAETCLTKKSYTSWEKINKDFSKITTNKNLLTKQVVRSVIQDEKLLVSKALTELLIMKPTRTLSGISSITIFTKPYTCSGGCIFCPTQENTPKSYLKDEPGIQRAISLDYDPINQIVKRIEALEFNGHPTEKIELIISGGTWDDYPLSYRYNFVYNVFKALNGDTDFTSDFTETSSNNNDDLKWNKLREIQEKNSISKHRCVGFSIETRPDKINHNMLSQLRRFGVTKIQIGIQSLHDDILKANARGHNQKIAQDAVDLARKAGFKIQVHWMCNLYKATPEIDLEDFQKLYDQKSIQPDEIKIYPCSLIEGTTLFKLYKIGKYTPYNEETLIKLLVECKKLIPKYTRISRLFRDIPSGNIIEGNKKTNLREIVLSKLNSEGNQCNCIRCREIKNGIQLKQQLILDIYKYVTNVSKEYFISYNTFEDNKIAGFLRLAIYNQTSDLINVKAMIREIHVYGKSLGIGEKNNKTQHQGIGLELIKQAEKIAKINNINRLGVISAVGTWEYYKKRGFEIDSEFGYGIKNL